MNHMIHGNKSARRKEGHYCCHEFILIGPSTSDSLTGKRLSPCNAWAGMDSDDSLIHNSVFASSCSSVK
ncbi:hypothetical protein PROFUN_05436 [Planoprotostelium fungivorum]|uniref:Uncharacterized protein n=1 Tax=Planoprotostelium fungivorum TaxID=1890364 RepID=A0A2P6NQR1_9EUKA|nr:hypothetical protein PROFUN_05436 [Planoprotostelium fungivorum]